jgi:Periplasmic component of the Tol biopolymer transport system
MTKKNKITVLIAVFCILLLLGSLTAFGINYSHKFDKRFTIKTIQSVSPEYQNKATTTEENNNEQANEVSVATNTVQEQPVEEIKQCQISNGFVYMKSDGSVQDGAEIFKSSFDGLQKCDIQSVPKFVGPLENNDVSPDGTIAYVVYSDFSNESKHSIFVSTKGNSPKEILSLPDGQYVESVKISPDSKKIAYSLITYGNSTSTNQLWTINSDGTDNKMVIDNTRRFITDSGPFRLAPLEWSKDETKIYMITTTDSDATPRGMYIADLKKSTIKKANTPDITLWDLSFSPDRTKIVYKTFQWKSVQDSYPERGEPYTINITDLNTGETKEILNSKVDNYSDPVWSPDGKNILFKIGRDYADGGDAGILIVNINSQKTSVVVPRKKNTLMTPWVWLSNDEVVYTEATYTSGQIQDKVNSYLFTIKTDGTGKHLVDSALNIIVFGSLSNMAF